MVEKNRAWFLVEDGRFPSTLHTMYNWRKTGILHIEFKHGKKHDINAISPLPFYIELSKFSVISYILKWDFLFNSTGVPLVNKKAVKVLEELANGRFQIIPAELLLPNGEIIKDYGLLNVTNKIEAVDYERSIPKKGIDKPTKRDYEVYYYKTDCLKDNENLGIDCIIICSTKLKNRIKEEKLTGATFKGSYGSMLRFLDE